MILIQKNIHSGFISVVKILNLLILLWKDSKKQTVFIIMEWKYVYVKMENGQEVVQKYHIKNVQKDTNWNLVINLIIPNFQPILLTVFHTLTQK
jgi:hypothetical protein